MMALVPGRGRGTAGAIRCCWPAIFAAIALAALAAGIAAAEEVHLASTTILVEESNIIKPLMEGRAVPTGVANRAAIAREVAFSRTRDAARSSTAGGWMKANPDAAGAGPPDRADHRAHRIIQSAREPDPDHLRRLRRRNAPTRSPSASPSWSSRRAWRPRNARAARPTQFIDSQVSQYHHKLTDAEAKLEQYRTLQSRCASGHRRRRQRTHRRTAPPGRDRRAWT